MEEIVINGRFLSRPITGVERFAREICKSLDELLDEVDSPARFIIIGPTGTYKTPIFRNIRVRKTGSLRGHAWEQISLPMAARRSLVVNLCSTAPVLARKVSCIHDANVYIAPENYTVPFVCLYRILLPLVARTSKACFTISRYSAETLLENNVFTRMPEIIPNGHEHIVRQKAELPSEAVAAIKTPYVLLLGSRSKSKNIDLILNAASRLRALGLSIVIAGGKNSGVFAQYTPDSGKDVDVIDLGRVSDADILHLYRNAHAFLFPSLHEGFGIPPIEAMAVGCPVVASAASAMPEVLGDAAVLCDPYDVGPWIDAIVALKDDRVRAQTIERGRQCASRYTWRRSAALLYYLLMSVQRRPEPASSSVSLT